MDVFSALTERHSYREPFKPIPIPQKDLRAIVDAGLKAPSGKNEQTTSFIIVHDQKKVRAIADMHTQKAMNTAQAFIACIIDKQPPAVYEGVSFQIEDCAAAVENMLLAITALGYASVWIDGWLRGDRRAEKIGTLLGVPEHKTIRVLLPVGIPAVAGPRKEKKPFEERAWFDRWEGK